MNARFASVLLVLSLGCSEQSELYVELRSNLSIPGDTNVLAVRAFEDRELGDEGDERRVLVEQSYTLGPEPRNAWPQLLPIIGSELGPKSFALRFELRRVTEDGSSRIVGFHATDVISMPKTGRREYSILIPRACSDSDGDEYGLGEGCIALDCDDKDATRPLEGPCPEDPLPPPASGGDASVTDSGDQRPDDGGVVPPDAGPSQPNPDGGFDAAFDSGFGAVPDSGFDAGLGRPDAHVPVDAGWDEDDYFWIVRCRDPRTLEYQCDLLDERCVSGQCLTECSLFDGCPPGQVCLLEARVCYCEVPCTERCGALECVNGCCER